MEFHKKEHQKAHITKQRILAKDTMEVSLWIDGPSFNFNAGQYIKVTVPHLLLSASKGNSRDFSISSSSNQKNLITIAFRVSDSEFKQSLVGSPEGTPLDIHGPLGVFTLPDDVSIPLVFIAGGIGITPFLSMIRYATESHLPTKITLLYVNGALENTPYLSELEELQKRNSSFILQTHYGIVDENFLKQNVSEQTNAQWYIAGPPGMVYATRNILLINHIKEENILTEDFSGYDDSETYKKEILDNNKNTTSVFDIPKFSQNNLESLLKILDKIALVSTTDLDGAITYANDTFAKISKHTREELIGNNHRILKSGFHPQSFYDSMWHDYLLKGKIWRGEIKNRAKDGTFYWVDSSIAPIFDESNNVIGYVAIRFPITDKKEVQQSLGLYSNILKQTTQPWGMANLDGTIVECNQSFVDLFGYTFDELMTMNYGQLIENNYQQKIQMGVQEVLKNNKSFTATAIFLKKDGSKINISLTVNGYFIDNKPSYVFAFLTDITNEIEMIEKSDKTNRAMINILEDAQMLEESLKKEQYRLKTILSTMGEGLFVVDAQSAVLLINKTAQKILEIPEQLAMGKNSKIAFPMLFKNGKKVLDNERPALMAITTGETITGLLTDNYQYQLTSGRKIYIALIVTPMKNEDGVVQGAIVIFRDVTDEKKLDDTRETFISIASHQLRTPLTSIRWYTEMLSAGDAGPLLDQQKAFLDNIYTGVLRLSETLNMLLSLSRIESGRVKREPVDIDLVSLSKDVAKELLPYSHAKNLTIEIDLKNIDNAHIKIDESMLRQVIMNLFSNAIRYTENKTTIQVTIEPKEDYWLYSVADKGIGISEENESRIFEKFFRADNAVALVPDGNGLGLALVKDLVELWDGKVWFDSEMDKGSIFYFTIPYKGMEGKSEGKSLS